jgi:hypothetical protein
MGSDASHTGAKRNPADRGSWNAQYEALIRQIMLLEYFNKTVTRSPEACPASCGVLLTYFGKPLSQLLQL